MALDLEEQEQLAELKSWWKDNGGRIIFVVVAVAVGIAGWRGWDWYQRDQAVQASGLYESVHRAVQADDMKALREASGALAENYPRTRYATLGALVAARYYFDKGDAKSAKAQLQWVLERTGSGDLRDIARLRLAALLLDEGSHEQALKLLEESHADAYTAQYAALRGDVLVAARRIDDAKTAYRLALDKARADDTALRASVRMRLDALGG